MSHVIKIKNNTVDPKTWGGQAYAASEEIVVESSDVGSYKKDSYFMADVAIGDASIGDASSYFNAELGWDYLLGNIPLEINAIVDSQPPFAAKTLSDGSKIYRRKHGFSVIVPANSSAEVTLTNPYISAKINEMELTNCTIGDSVDLKVYDTVSGLYQQMLGVPAGSVDPDLMLNQFGFGVQLPEGMYKDISSYDADLVGGMRVKLTYYNSTANSVTIYGNIVYHEVKQ